MTSLPTDATGGDLDAARYGAERADQISGTYNTPVFPVLPNDKRPATPHGFHDAVTGTERIHALFDQHGLAGTGNIGAPVTAGRLVLDFDLPAAGKWGRGPTDDHIAAVQRVEQVIDHMHQRGLLALPSWVVRTASGGYHIWQAVPDGIDTDRWPGKISIDGYDLVDLRKPGKHYVLMPGSAMCGTHDGAPWGGEYVEILGPSTGVPLAAAPTKLIEFLDTYRKVPAPRATASPPVAIATAGGHDQARAVAAISALVAKLAATGSGQRHDRLLKWGKSAFQTAIYYGLDLDQVEAQLRAAAISNGYAADDGETAMNTDIADARRFAEQDGGRPLEDRPYNGTAIGPDSTTFVYADPADTSTGDTGGVGDGLDVRHLEGDFWTCRPASLGLIYDAALARMCGPWTVFGHVAARVLATVPPTVELPDYIGRGSLNFIAALSGKSGGTKSAGSRNADQLVGDLGPVVVRGGLGSGEGFLDAYRRDPEPTSEPAQPPWHESVLFNLDEIDQFAAVVSRGGNTLPSLIKTGFSGGMLDLPYKGRKDPLPAGGYRMTVVMGVQPGKAGVLFDDTEGGTPQRLAWFPSTDPRVSISLADHTAQRRLHLPARNQYRPGHVKVPDAARAAILQAAQDSGRGIGDPLDGHALFVREKIAYAIAVLDGRTSQVSADDWRLSGIVAAVSAHTRGWVQQHLQRAEVTEAERRGSLDAARAAGRDAETHRRVEKATRRVADNICRYLTDAGGRLNMQGINRKVAGRDKNLIDSALELLTAAGRVEQIDGEWSVKS